MSMRTFLFAADALRNEEGVSWTVAAPKTGTRARDTAQDTRNADMMAQFMGGMKGVQVGKGKR